MATRPIAEGAFSPRMKQWPTPLPHPLKFNWPQGLGLQRHGPMGELACASAEAGGRSTNGKTSNAYIHKYPRMARRRTILSAHSPLFCVIHLLPHVIFLLDTCLHKSLIICIICESSLHH